MAIDMSNMSPEKAAALQIVEEARDEQWQGGSFAREIFMGNLPFDRINPFPDQSAEDIKAGEDFLTKFEKFLIEEVDPDQIDRDGEIPQSVFDGLAKLGAFGIKIPTKYGGLGLSQTNYLRAASLMGSYCGNISCLLSAHQSIGVPQPLIKFGTDAQKEKYLPRVAAGEISAFALTETGVGSDPAKMITRAVPTDDGEAFIINGEKMWCTNGTCAGVIVVMAQTPDKVIHGKPRKQITCFIVEMNTPGVTVTNRCRFMGLKAIYNAMITFDNVRVPRENVIDAEGRGLKIALTTLNTGRLTVGGGCAGMAKRCLRIVKDWSNERVQWGQAIGKHATIANKITIIAARTFAMEAISLLTARMVDLKQADIRLESAMCKMKCSEDGWDVVNETMQIRGGRGYETAQSLADRGDVPLSIERMMRDSRINTIFEGSSEIMRLFIAREALDKHLSVGGDVVNTRLPMGKRLACAVKAGLFYAKWYPLLWLPRPTKGLSGVDPVLAAHVRRAAGFSRRLARQLFHGMVRFGPKLELEQVLLQRYVDIGTSIFAMSAVCARATSLAKSDPSKRKEHTDLADMCCRLETETIRQRFAEHDRNNDRKSYDVAQSILAGDYDWLTEGALEEKFTKSDNAQPSEKRHFEAVS